MFNNLIESSSHAREFKRRGSFVLFTTAIYGVLFIAAGVASIYAYDARLEDQNLQFVTMLSPLDYPAPPAPTRNAPPPKAGSNQQVATRQVAMAPVTRPELVPSTPSAKPNPFLPVPPHGEYVIGPRDSDPVGPGNVGNGNGHSGTGNGTPTPTVDLGTPPPPDPPVHKPAPMVSKGVVTGLAIALPKPVYSAIAKQAGARGAVNVQVVIDEYGKVISANAVSGNPMLRPAAQQAAMGARFSPTKLGDQPVKVSGVITYNFVLN